MLKLSITLSVFFITASSVFAQIVIKDKTSGANVSPLLKEPALNANPGSKADTIRIKTAAYLFGALNARWETQKQYPVTYKIEKVELRDTVFEKAETLKKLAAHEDSTSYKYKMENTYKELLTKITDPGMKTEYEGMYKEAVQERIADKEKLLKEMATLKDTDILQIKTLHTVLINGVQKQYTIIYGKTTDGGYSPYLDKAID